MANGKLNGWSKVLVSIATTLVLIGGAWATMRHQVDDNTGDITGAKDEAKADMETLKAEGCNPARTNAYNMVRIETMFANMEKQIEDVKQTFQKEIDDIKKENDYDHKDIMTAINGSP